MSFLGRLFGKKESAPADDGIYLYVRCSNCQRVLHTRLDPQRELNSTDDGFVVTKEMMDDRCFRRITLHASFDASRRLQEATVDGGQLIERDEWEAEKNLPRRPPMPEDESPSDL